ncbi:MAG: nucleotidyl transferase AbiEii/AbiGii toxin family protein [bacterium]
MNQEALSEKGKKILSELRNFSNFYLAGGTALALQIGHRKSADFDLFSEKKISGGLLSKIKNVFHQNSFALSVNNPDELTVFIDGIKITFLKYPFRVISKLVEYEGVNLLSIKEIAATKAYTVGRRCSYKDYIDLYFIISEHLSDLNEIIKLAEKKYGGEFNSRLFLEQLVYVEDIKDTEIIFLKQAVGKKDVESFFQKKIGEIKL